MPSALIVSNQPEACEAIARDVAGAGLDTLTAADLSQGLEIIERRRPDLVVLDLLDRTLSPESTWRVQLERAPVDLPFIVMLPDEGLKDFAFPSRVVVFILVPYGAAELYARLMLAIGPRAGANGSVIERGTLAIDPDRYQVTLGGAPLELTLKEFELLRFLVEHPGRVHTRESLMNQVWGYDYFGGTRTVDVHIRRIRAKLEPEADEYIETVRGVGYRFRE